MLASVASPFYGPTRTRRSISRSLENRRAEYITQPGLVEDVLRDLRLATYRVQYLIGQLAERKKEVHGNSTKDEVRVLTRELQSGVDTLAVIVNDDPGVVLSAAG
jgi:hypothetical protein